MTLLALLLAAVAAAAPAKTVHLKTDDGWTLAAAYAPAKKGRPVAVFAHGVAAGHGEYDAFASTLQARGWGTLALDLRGHGGSTDFRGARRTFEDFDKTDEWSKMTFDILAAAQFLEKQGVKETQVALIGGSLGANVCARVFAALPRARALVLLSPGLEYRGVTMVRVDGAKTIAAASPGDGYAFASVQTMQKNIPGLTVLTAKSGHGAQLLNDPDFVRALLKRLQR